jgi:hypothetical protein
MAAGFAFAATQLAGPAQAQNTRSFVSGLGSDSNNCSLAAPCRSFQHAHDQTFAGGEIAVLDTAGYGTVIINRAISIVNPGGVEAGILVPSGGTAITINAGASDAIILRGLTVEGAGIGGTGIAFNSGGSLVIRNSVIRNFTGACILFQPNTAGVSHLNVSDTLVSDSGGGIGIGPSDTGTTYGVLDRVHIEHNTLNGILISTTTQAINVTISDSVSASNGEAGILASSIGGTPVNVMVRNSTIANNGGDGLDAFGSSGTTIRVTRSTITGNNTGAWSVANGGSLLSYADNNIDGNSLSNALPPTKPYK